ncbi:hypothetical protein GCM10023081_36930 [Arthrobacter ginkgonis]|uniref:3-hydroxyisobutyrate dehydrogenase n=1 Tax=Arthrobacter ginkgonis TaxID=1630594 RepID=A0ABP7CXP8_9MICC
MTTEIPAEPKSILFIGLGAMGEPMAANLSKGGAQLSVYDLSEDRRAEVAENLGAVAVPDPVVAAAEQDAVVLMLPSSAVVESLLLEQGLLESLKPGSLVIDMSSSHPDSTRKLAEIAAAQGIRFIDAPVSGGRAKAITGELAIMAGGQDNDFAAALPVLKLLGSKIFHAGGHGAGHAMKALNNLLSATGLAAAAEVMAAGAKYGLRPETMLDILNNSTGSNQATQVKFAKFILSRAFNSGFAMDLMVKDLGIAAEILPENHGEPSIVRSTVQLWQEARRELDDRMLDHTAVTKWIEHNAGVVLSDESTTEP